jgi:hypothetical protein
MAQFRHRLEAHKQTVEGSLVEYLASSRRQLVDHFFPVAVEAPPDGLLGQIMGHPSEDQVRAWLEAQLDRVFPQPRDLVADMRLEVLFRDVAYETLQEAGFGEKLREVFPHVEWDKPFHEFDAARARST